MGARLGLECVCRERSSVACIPCGQRSQDEPPLPDELYSVRSTACAADGGGEGEDDVEALRRKVSQLRRRNAILEEAARAKSSTAMRLELSSDLRHGASSSRSQSSTLPDKGPRSSGFSGKRCEAEVDGPMGKKRRASVSEADALDQRRRHTSPGRESTCSDNSCATDTAVPSSDGTPCSTRSALPIGLVFPNQMPGLHRELSRAVDDHRVQALLRRADDVLEYNLEQLFASGPSAKLDATKYNQAAVYVASVAAAERLREERPEAFDRCRAVAGVGVGEFVALHAAGVFDFELGLKLVSLRAEEMHRAASSAGPRQQQISLVGVELERARALCEEARRSCGVSVAPGGAVSPRHRGGGMAKPGEEVLSVACAVAPKAQVCAGTEAAAHHLLALGQGPGSLEWRAHLMEISPSLGQGAFNTSLMHTAQCQLRAALWEALPQMRPPRCAVYFNVMGEALPAGAQPSLVAELLAAELTSTMLWEQTVRTMLREGLDELVVCGPSSARRLVEVIGKISPEAGRKTTSCTI